MAPRIFQLRPVTIDNQDFLFFFGRFAEKPAEWVADE
jgi:hypothetical protein